MSVAAGYTLQVTVHFSQAVKVTGTPQVTMVNGQEGGGSAATRVLSYASGTTTEELLFTLVQLLLVQQLSRVGDIMWRIG